MFGAGGIERARAATRAADEMLEFVELADRRHEPVGALNLHEQRFLEIARQLAARPKLVLLDEVMAGLNDSELSKRRSRWCGAPAPSTASRSSGWST